MFATGAEVDAALGAGVRPEGLAVLLVRLDAGDGDDVERWVVDDVGGLIGHLRLRFADDSGSGRGPDQAGARRPEHGGEHGPGREQAQIVAVVLAPEATSARQAAAIEATWQAARGVIQSLTRELGARKVRLNAVRAPVAAPDPLHETLAFLAGPRAGFVAGSSFDLMPTAAGPETTR